METIDVTASELADIYDERALQLERAHNEIMEAVKRLSFTKETRKSPVKKADRKEDQPTNVEPIKLDKQNHGDMRTLVREELKEALRGLVAV